jgi:succinate dehydrogenase/fumarate reductase cytochrome b subunit
VARAADNGRLPSPRAVVVQTLIIVAFLILILWNLGAGLYYMMVDKGQTNRTVKSLTWRIGLSVALILLVMLGIFTGVIEPHGIRR